VEVMMLKSKPEKHGKTLTAKPAIRVSIRAVMARINRIEGYKVMKYYRREAPPNEQMFILRTKTGEEALRRVDFVNRARELKALESYEFMND
jgi:hypothetical protein